jgi:hypothetical protein
LGSVAASAITNVLAGPSLSWDLSNIEQKKLQQALLEVTETIESLPDDEFLAEGAILSVIEQSEQAAFDQINSILCGGDKMLDFTPVIKLITMIQRNAGLRVLGVVDDDDPTELHYAWSYDGQGLEVISAVEGFVEALYTNFIPELPQQVLSFHVTACGLTPISESCLWIVGSSITKCEF